MEYKLLNLENDKKTLFVKKWNFNCISQYKNSLHSCKKKNGDDWRIDGKSYIFKLSSIIYLLNKSNPVLIHHDDVCFKYKNNKNKKKYIDFEKNILNPQYEKINMIIPCIAVKTTRNPEKKMYRCIEGSLKLIKLQENNIYKSYFYIINEDSFLNNLIKINVKNKEKKEENEEKENEENEKKENEEKENEENKVEENENKIILDPNIKYNYMDINWLKKSIHSCLGEWEIDNKDYIFYIHSILYDILETKPLLIEHSEICFKKKLDEKKIIRFKNANIKIPGILVETNKNPENKKYRCVDGSNRISKLKKKNINKSYFYIINEETFLNNLFLINKNMVLKPISYKKALEKKMIENSKINSTILKTLFYNNFSYLYPELEIKLISHENLIYKKYNISYNISKNNIYYPCIVIKKKDKFLLLSSKSIIDKLNKFSIFKSYFIIVDYNLKNYNYMKTKDIIRKECDLKTLINKSFFLSKHSINKDDIKNEIVKNFKLENNYYIAFFFEKMIKNNNFNIKPELINHDNVSYKKNKIKNSNCINIYSNINIPKFAIEGISKTKKYYLIDGRNRLQKLKNKNVKSSYFYILKKNVFLNVLNKITKHNEKYELQLLENIFFSKKYGDDCIKNTYCKNHYNYNYLNKNYVFYFESLWHVYYYLTIFEISKNYICWQHKEKKLKYRELGVLVKTNKNSEKKPFLCIYGSKETKKFLILTETFFFNSLFYIHINKINKQIDIKNPNYIYKINEQIVLKNTNKKIFMYITFSKYPYQILNSKRINLHKNALILNIVNSKKKNIKLIKLEDFLTYQNVKSDSKSYSKKLLKFFYSKDLKKKFYITNKKNKFINVYYNEYYNKYIILNNFSKIEKLTDVGINEIYCNVIQKEDIFTITELRKMHLFINTIINPKFIENEYKIEYYDIEDCNFFVLELIENVKYCLLTDFNKFEFFKNTLFDIVKCFVIKKNDYKKYKYLFKNELFLFDLIDNQSFMELFNIDDLILK